MARTSVNITIGTSLADGTYAPSVARAGVPDFATGTDQLTAVGADVATLVADGATPTQGHVNTLNTDFAAFNTGYTALKATIVSDVTVIWNTGTVTHRNQMRAALLTVMRAIEGGYGGLAE